MSSRQGRIRHARSKGGPVYAIADSRRKWEYYTYQPKHIFKNGNATTGITKNNQRT